jgi:hypothetical protein
MMSSACTGGTYLPNVSIDSGPCIERPTELIITIPTADLMRTYSLFDVCSFYTHRELVVSFAARDTNECVIMYWNS